MSKKLPVWADKVPHKVPKVTWLPCALTSRPLDRGNISSRLLMCQSDGSNSTQLDVAKTACSSSKRASGREKRGAGNDFERGGRGCRWVVGAGWRVRKLLLIPKGPEKRKYPGLVDVGGQGSGVRTGRLVGDHGKATVENYYCDIFVPVTVVCLLLCLKVYRKYMLC